MSNPSLFTTSSPGMGPVEREFRDLGYLYEGGLDSASSDRTAFPSLRSAPGEFQSGNGMLDSLSACPSGTTDYYYGPGNESGRISKPINSHSLMGQESMEFGGPHSHSVGTVHHAAAAQLGTNGESTTITNLSRGPTAQDFGQV